jgi:primosomal replication protein N
VLRYTPAGVPVLNLTISHESSKLEDSKPRNVIFDIPAKLIGNLAEKGQQLILGQQIYITGFLAKKSIRSAQLVLHVTDFEIIIE